MDNALVTMILKFLNKVPFLGKQRNKPCASRVDATGEMCTEWAWWGSRYCGRHQGTFSWFLRLLASLLIATIGFTAKEMKQHFWPSVQTKAFAEWKRTQSAKPTFEFRIAGITPTNGGVILFPAGEAPGTVSVPFQIANNGSFVAESTQVGIRVHRGIGIEPSDGWQRINDEGDGKTFGYIVGLPIYPSNSLHLPGLKFQPAEVIENCITLYASIRSRNTEVTNLRPLIRFQKGTNRVR